MGRHKRKECAHHTQRGHSTKDTRVIDGQARPARQGPGFTADPSSRTAHNSMRRKHATNTTATDAAAILAAIFEGHAALRRRMRLPLPIAPNRCGGEGRGCGGVPDAFGDHALTCPWRSDGSKPRNHGAGWWAFCGSRAQIEGIDSLWARYRPGSKQPCAREDAALRKNSGQEAGLCPGARHSLFKHP